MNHPERAVPESVCMTESNHRGKRRARAVVFVAALAGVAACGPGGTVPGACSANEPTSCPSPAPSYTADVAPIVTRRCRPCHTAGGSEETAALDTYEQARARREEIMVRVKSCLMPPADQPQLTDAERTALLGWLDCGAAND